MNQPKFFGERYELGEVLGHGGMAEVRIGIDRRLGRTVAVKVLRADLANDPTFQARFRREAQSAAALNHPAIVAVYDTGEELVDGVPVPYIVMEYVEGRTLRDVLKEGRRILPERALEITADVLEALEYSHRAGIVHRDIKPGNVMLTPNGDVKVMDFGIARAVADASATMTQTAAVIGTAQYLSPEQARGETVDARSDIYSTGCLLYELLTGRPPFVGDSPVSVAYQHVREEPQPPSMLDPEVTREGDAITMKALQKRPMDRYQTADEMRGDLVRALAGQRVATPAVMGPPPDATSAFAPVEPPPYFGDQDGWQEEPEQGQGRRKWLWVTLTAVIVIALIAIGFLLFQFFGGNNAPVPNLAGQTLEQAKQTAAQSGFTVKVGERVANAEVPKGQIFEQDPVAETEEEEGSTITVTISTGEPTDAVPDGLVGSKVGEAERILTSAGFQVNTKQNKKSDRPKNEVIGVDPGEGEDVPQGSTITLEYSAGYVEVPDVRQQSVDDATSTLEDAGLKVTVEEQDTEGEEGVVLDQDPKPSSRHPSGTEVTIYIPKPVEQPNLMVEGVPDPSTVAPGGNGTLHVNVTNNGAGPGDSNPVVSVQLPDGVAVTAPPSGCSGDGSTLSCELSAPIDPGQSGTFQIPFQVSDDVTPGPLQGTVAVEVDGDEDPNDNSSTFDLMISPF